MKRLAAQSLLGLTAVTAVAGAGLAARSGHQPVIIVEPWARATSPHAAVGAGYLVIRNTGDVPDRLLSIASPAAKAVQLHSMEIVGGVMRMRPITGNVTVPAHGETRFEPGANHIMFIDLQQPFIAGSSVPATLRFARAGTLSVSFRIRSADAQAPAAGHLGMR